MTIIATTHIKHGLTGGDEVVHYYEGDVIPDGILSDEDVDSLSSVDAIAIVADEAVQAEEPVDPKDKKADAAKSSGTATT